MCVNRVKMCLQNPSWIHDNIGIDIFNVPFIVRCTKIAIMFCPVGVEDWIWLVVTGRSFDDLRL